MTLQIKMMHTTQNSFKRLLNFTLTVVCIAFISCKEEESCNADTCSNGNCSSGACVCNSGFEGTECVTEQRAKFLGLYSFSENCNGSTFNYNASIGKGATIDGVILYDFYALPNTTINAKVYGQNITIAQQTILHDGNEYSITGSGSINGQVLTLNYTMDTPNKTDLSCAASGQKQ